VWLARTLCALDRLDDAQDCCDEALTGIPGVGNVAMLPPAHATRARILLARGQLVDAVVEAEAGIAAMDATDGTQMSADLFSTLAYLRFALGDDDAAQESLTRCAERLRAGLVEVGHLALARAQVATSAPAEALAACVRLIDATGTDLTQLVMDAANGPALARLAVDAGDTARAAKVAAAVARLAGHNPTVRSLQSARRHVDGLVAGDVTELRAAADGYRAVDRQLAAAVALADAAVVSCRAGAPSATVDAETAHAALVRLGAEGLARRLRHATDGAVGRRTRPARPVAGWGSLTEAELRVVALVATGATNKEVARQLWLSPYTVDTHVRHALAKLGLHSRVEMARQAGARGILPAAVPPSPASMEVPS
jgi:DNA-binding CsgD family transcriptional regulator